MTLTYVRKYTILAAGTVSFKGTNGKTKIPDFIVIIPDFRNSGKCQVTVIEIKPCDKEMISLIEDYCTNGFGRKELHYDFWSLTSTRINKHKKQIIEAIGQEEFKRQSNAFRAQRGKVEVEGFCGEANPMWGRKHSPETLKLMAEIASINSKGEKNPMYGRTHTPEANLKIAAKWLDEDKKIAMLRKGMLNHYANFDEEQRAECMQYFSARLSNEKCKAPAFMNRCYYISSTEKIEKWFGSVENFISDLLSVEKSQIAA